MVLHRIKFIFLLVLFALFGCTGTKQTEQTIAQANTQGFAHQIQDTHFFKLTTFSKLERQGDPIVVYIEGDGHSMASKYKLSKNPTPYQPLALQLAMLDKRPNVIYIARPCQYTPLHQDKHCHPKYWSTHRLSKKVVSSTIEVINRFKEQNKTNVVHLVGFSGGGGLAALIAAFDKDITTLVTVAGDLNTKMMEQTHNITPQVGSLNPLDYAHAVTVPQLHLSGAKDTVVSPMIAHSFIQASSAPCKRQHIEQSFSHHHGWLEAWPFLLTYIPCQDEQDSL